MTEPQALVDAALAASHADGCAVIVHEHSETNLRWAGNALTTNGLARSRSVTVVSFAHGAEGTGTGVVTRSITSAEEVDELVRAADAAAADAPPAEDAMPLVEPYGDGGGDGWDDDARATDVRVFEAMTGPLGATFARWAGEDRLLYGFAEHQLTSTFLGTSTGLRRRADQPDGRLEVNGKSADLTRSAWYGQHTVDFTDVDVDAVAAHLEQRLGWAARDIELPAGRYETLLPPGAVADLMIYLYWTAAARDADEGRSVFSATGASGASDGLGTRVGERLSPLPLTLRSDPAAAGLQCADFEVAGSSSGMQSVFDNGLPIAATEWIADGTLRELIRTRSWAERHGGDARPAVGNLILDAGGTAELDDMIARTERGLLLTCLWYIREVDPQTLLLTGLTRDGVYLVEDGEVRGAVNNFRFNESPVDLLGRVTEAGRTQRTLPREWNDYFRRTAMPPLRIPDFHMSTVSQAR